MILGVHVPSLLGQLESRGDALSLAAARVIREQEIQLSSLDEEVIASEFRIYALAVEIERMSTHRRAVADREVRRGQRRAA